MSSRARQFEDYFKVRATRKPTLSLRSVFFPLVETSYAVPGVLVLLVGGLLHCIRPSLESGRLLRRSQAIDEWTSASGSFRYLLTRSAQTR